MAKTLSVVFKMVDQMSSKLASVANAGNTASKSLDNIQKSANPTFQTVDKGAETAQKAIQTASESTTKWANAMETCNKSASEFASADEELSEMGDRVQESLDAGTDAADQAAKKLGELGEETEKAGKKTEEYSRQTEKSREETEKNRKENEKYREETEKNTEAISKLDQVLAGAGVVAFLSKITSAFAECAQAGEEYESSIAKLQTISGGAGISSLSSDIKELSNDTGIAATDLADVAYNAISAGTSVEDAVEMAGTASKLAVAGFTDSSSALSVLTTALNAYGDSAGTAEEISDSLITVQNLGVTTVADLSANMGKAIASASAYNVNLSNLESAYISTTKAGINTAESTTYISSMLKELGDSGTDVAKIIQDTTGKSFGQLMSDGYSLADVLEILYDNVNGDGEALMNLWGSAEAGKAANAILSQGLSEFNSNLEAVSNSAGATASAYSIMADTTEYAHERMNNAALNLKETVGSELNPSLESLYNIGAKVFEFFASLAERFPVLTHLVTAFVAEIGTLVAIIGVYTVGAKAAAVVQKLLEVATASTAATIALETAAIGAAVVAIALLASMTLKTSDASDSLTVASQKQADELSSLQTQYENTCAVQGESSDAAVNLKMQIDELSDSYENSKQTVAEFYAEVDSLVSKHEEIMSSYNETNSSIREQEVSTNNLVSKLRELKSGADDAGSAQEQMKSIVQELNQMYPDLGISISDVNGDLDGLVDRINAVSNAQNTQTKYDSASETYSKLVQEQEELQAARDAAYEQYVKASENYAEAGKAQGTYAELTGTGVAKALSDAKDAYEAAENALEENEATIDECSATMEEYNDIINGTSEDVVEQGDAVAIAIGQQSDALDELAAKYDEAYSSALSSIEGQYSLWETVEDVATTSVSDIMAAMDSQISYWETYAENLENLAGRNIEGLDAMVASMDDGSEDSAAALAAMAAASDEELTSMVSSFNDLQNAQSQTAADVADLETDFSNSLSEMESDMEQTVDKMNMEDDAKAAAKATMQGYIDGILSMKNAANSAAESVSSATTAALSGTTVTGHAQGTTDSGRFYLAGEEGPELIVSPGGDTVFPHAETEKIINKLTDTRESNDNPVISVGSVGASTPKTATNTSTSEEKTITLKLEGSGSIAVGQNTSPESVWDSIKDNLKSTFVNLLQEEMYEEGAGVYEF